MTKPGSRRRFWYAARIYYLLFCVGALVLAMLEGSRITSGLLYAALLILPVSALHAGLLRGQLYVSHGADKKVCVRSEPLRYMCVCQNKGILSAPWIYFRIMASRSILEAPAVRVFACAPYEKNKWETTLLPVHRGRYILSVEDAACGDLFSQLRMKLKTPEDVEVLVLPKIIPLREEWKQRLIPVLTGEEHVLVTDEPAVEARNYRYGDSMRRIHWNLTARSREIMVREIEKQTERRILCVLDTSPFESDRPLDCEDTLIEACLSVLRYALENRFETVFIYGADDEVLQIQGNNLHLFDSIHSAMSAVTFTADISLGSLLAYAEKAYLILLFTTKPPADAFLAALPAGRPSEIFLVRTHKDMPIPEIQESDMLHITLLDLEP